MADLHLTMVSFVQLKLNTRSKKFTHDNTIKARHFVLHSFWIDMKEQKFLKSLSIWHGSYWSASVTMGTNMKGNERHWSSMGGPNARISVWVHGFSCSGIYRVLSSKVT